MTIFSVASNRKPNLVSTHKHTYTGGLESKGKKAIPISYAVLFQVAMCAYSPTAHTAERGGLLRAGIIRGKGKFGGWGHTFDVVLVFFVFPDAPAED